MTLVMAIYEDGGNLTVSLDRDDGERPIAVLITENEVGVE